MGIFRALALSLLLACATAQADDIHRRQRIAPADYPVALESLQIAIQNQGLAITARHEAAKVLARTAEDLGHRPDLLRDGEILSFCSIRIGALLVAEDPHNIAYCPMGIAIYRIPDDPGAVYLAWRRVQGDTPGAKAANALLQKIVDETAASALE